MRYLAGLPSQGFSPHSPGSFFGPNVTMSSLYRGSSASSLETPSPLASAASSGAFLFGDPAAANQSFWWDPLLGSSTSPATTATSLSGGLISSGLLSSGLISSGLLSSGLLSSAPIANQTLWWDPLMPAWVGAYGAGYAGLPPLQVAPLPPAYGPPGVAPAPPFLASYSNYSGTASPPPAPTPLPLPSPSPFSPQGPLPPQSPGQIQAQALALIQALSLDQTYNSAHGAAAALPAAPGVKPKERRGADRQATSLSSTRGPRDGRQATLERIVGEIAFQLDRRILSSIFPDRIRLYGYTVENIPEKIAQGGSDPLSPLTPEQCTSMTDHYNDVMKQLKPIGYNPSYHPQFTEHIVNTYGILQGRPDTGLDGEIYNDVNYLREVIENVLPTDDRVDCLVLLNCLKALSQADGRPLFIW